MVFEHFRKQQKVMMAFLAIMAMIAFILGSFLTGFGGGGSARDQEITRAFGKPVMASQVSQLAIDRRRFGFGQFNGGGGGSIGAEICGRGPHTAQSGSREILNWRNSSASASENWPSLPASLTSVSFQRSRKATRGRLLRAFWRAG